MAPFTSWLIIYFPYYAYMEGIPDVKMRNLEEKIITFEKKKASNKILLPKGRFNAFLCCTVIKVCDRHTSLPGGKLNVESKKLISKHILCTKSLSRPPQQRSCGAFRNVNTKVTASLGLSTMSATKWGTAEAKDGGTLGLKLFGERKEDRPPNIHVHHPSQHVADLLVCQSVLQLYHGDGFHSTMLLPNWLFYFFSQLYCLFLHHEFLLHRHYIAKYTMTQLAKGASNFLNSQSIPQKKKNLKKYIFRYHWVTRWEWVAFRRRNTSIKMWKGNDYLE